MDHNAATEAWLLDFAAMQQERKMVDGFYAAASLYFDPLLAHHWRNSGSISKSNEQLNWNGDLFTGAGISSNNRLATFLMGNGTPPSSKWLDLTDVNPDIAAQEDVAQFWADATHSIEANMRGLAGRQSSFYIAMRDAYKNMGVSYGVVSVNEYRAAGRPTNSVFYEACQPYAFWFRLGAHGEMTHAAYLRHMTDEQARGMLDRNAHKVVSQLAGEPVSGRRRSILQMVKLNYDADPNPRDARDFLFQERWIDIAERKTLMLTGHRSQPFHVLGWNKVPSSHYFVGPAYDALPDVTGAAAARKAQLQAMAWQGRPPLLAGSKDGLGDPAKTLVPGRITFGVMNSEGKSMIKALESGMNASIFQYAVSDDEARVRELMMGDQLVSQRRPNMTATEVMEIAQERAQMVAPFMITTMPAIKGMVARDFEIKLRLGVLPPVPRSVALDGGLDVNVSGPLAIAARQADVGNVFTTLQQLEYAAKFDPAIARRVNGEEVSNLIATANGTISVLHSWDKVTREMQAEAAQNAQLAEAELGKMQAGAAKDEAAALSMVMQ